MPAAPDLPNKIADWDQDKLDPSYAAYFLEAIKASDGIIDWYNGKARKQGRSARFIRIASILLVGIAALAPLTGDYVQSLLI